MAVLSVNISDIQSIVAVVNAAYRGEDSTVRGWTDESHLLAGSRTGMADVTRLLGEPGSTFLKYVDTDGALTGCVHVQQQGNTLYLGMLSVSPAHQGAGIGKGLLAAAIGYGRERGCGDIQISVISERQELIAWYERHGYTRTGEIKPFPLWEKFGIQKKPLELVVLERGITPEGLSALILRKAALRPDKIALRYGEITVTYRALEERVSQLAGYLQHRGVRAEDRIGVALERSPDMVVALLAIVRIGAAYVPFDLSFPQNRIAFMLEDAGAAWVLASHGWGGHFQTTAREIILEDAWIGEQPELGREAQGGTGSQLAYILYTSGSTGKPKGVMVEHRSLLNLLHSLQHMPGMGEDDRVLAMTTIAFDIAAVELFLPLMTGAEVVLVDRSVARDGQALLDIIKRERITFVQGTPATWKMMLNAGWDTALDIKALCGGEALPRQLADALCARCRAVYNLYGPTETTIYSTGTQIFADGREVTIGTPVMRTQVYIMDKDMKMMPDGERGEICIGGEGVARGYIHSGGSAGRFLQDPYAGKTGAMMYRTGDIGRRLMNGHILFLGREDDQVKIRGHRVELGEIENHLIGLDDVQEAVVLFTGDSPDDRQLVAYVVAGGAKPTRERIAKWRQVLRKTLPAFMMPAVFVPVDALPLTEGGKVDRKTLATLPRADRVDPRDKVFETDTERLVAEVWRKVLNLAEVDRSDDFFELGGHSLIALEMMVELEKRTGKRLPMSALFQAATVERLSILLHEHHGSLTRLLVPIKPSGTKPPLYIVHGIGLTVMVFHGLAKNMDADQPVYGLQAWGLEDGTEPLHSIEEIAGCYVAEILEHNPDGPYLLAGYSLGGTIAYEMARQMKVLGKKIKLLVMLDSYAGDPTPVEGFLARRLYWLKSLSARALFMMSSFLAKPSKTLKYQWSVVRVRSRQLLGRPKPVDTGYRGALAESMLAALHGYRLLANEDDTIVLFRVRDRIYFLNDPIYLGWRPYAKKGLVIMEASGDHRTFLEPPNDRELARRLQGVLDGADLG